VGITGYQPGFPTAPSFSVQGVAAIAAEQDPVFQLFAGLDTSFSSSNPQGTGVV